MPIRALTITRPPTRQPPHHRKAPAAATNGSLWVHGLSHPHPGRQLGRFHTSRRSNGRRDTETGPPKVMKGPDPGAQKKKQSEAVGMCNQKPRMSKRIQKTHLCSVFKAFAHMSPSIAPPRRSRCPSDWRGTCSQPGPPQVDRAGTFRTPVDREGRPGNPKRSTGRPASGGRRWFHGGLSEAIGV